MYKERITKLNKIDYYGTGRKINAVELELNIRDWNGADQFAACASVWNLPHTDCVICGQCLEDLARFPAVRFNSLYKEVRRLWSLYHLKYLQDIPEPDRTKIYQLVKGEANQ